MWFFRFWLIPARLILLGPAFFLVIGEVPFCALIFRVKIWKMKGWTLSLIIIIKLISSDEHFWKYFQFAIFTSFKNRTYEYIDVHDTPLALKWKIIKIKCDTVCPISSAFQGKTSFRKLSVCCSKTWSDFLIQVFKIHRYIIQCDLTV